VNMCELCGTRCGCACLYQDARKRVCEAGGGWAETEVYCSQCGHVLGEVRVDG
jgi:hypothetical protein